jgi:UDP-N-acetylmuramyl tripeptide synthase
VRNRLAVWAGKTTLSLSRKLGHGGSSFPGLVALRIDPALLSRLSGNLNRGAIIVTGTNGKTTTSRLLAAVLQDAGLRLVYNRSGANLLSGLTSAFIESSSGGRVRADIALLEVDEATVPEAIREIRPSGVVVTNFFRDQLDRFGELDTTVSMVARGLDAMQGRGFVALNSDDPLVASLGRTRTGQVLYYGIEDADCGSRTMTQTREQRQCLVCGSPLGYEVFYYAHLGRYRCPSGDFDRPAPSFQAGTITLDGIRGSTFRLSAPERPKVDVVVRVPGLYNVYNGLAALTAALQLGISPARAASSIERAAASFGRMERLEIDGRSVLLALVKNPTGYNQVLETVLEASCVPSSRGSAGAVSRPSSTDAGAPVKPGRRFLMALNDNWADGTDISWIWDVDFEILARPEANLGRIVTSGTRAYDLALRLKYAGVPEPLIEIVPDLGQALSQAVAGTAPGETLFVTPTYTAMLGLRACISRQGLAPQFWETGI